jgi:primosomal protein N' (replication factor Y)
MCDLEKHPLYAGVVLDEAIETILDYSVPIPYQGQAEVGSRVIVPVKNTLRKGTIWQLKKKPDFPSPKPIHELASEQTVLTKDLILLAEWISSYYCTPLHKVLKCVLPSSIRSHMKEMNQWMVKALLPKEHLLVEALKLEAKSPKQAALLRLLAEAKAETPLSLLLSQAKASQTSIASLEKRKWISLSLSVKERAPAWDDDYFLSKAKELSQEQSTSLEIIKAKLKESSFSTHLLYGVTGSGKTEVYLQAIEEALLLGKGVIFLVPEIALTSQTIERLKSRFEEKIAILHYRLSEGEKRDAWHQIQCKKARIVIGARSAVFSPMPDLGLIIVDEEHDGAYKHCGDSPTYHARDVAIVRSKLCNAVTILGSATPSLETYQNALSGKYHLHILSQRLGSAKLPEVRIVNMKHEYEKKKGFTLFSDPLLAGMKKRLQSGEQTLLLLNRRGYHTSQICLKCSEVAKCPHCDTSLTFHLGENILACHLCDYQTSPSRTCPSCKGQESMKFQGAGTELVEKQLYAIFPGCRVLRMDADTTKRKGSHDVIFKQFRSGKADILVGTQMIAKGLHFPSVTLVGVLNADLTLSIPDFRASETMFQLITQVAGRSGRGELPGEVIVQTLLPGQSTLQLAAAQNYTRFFEEESEVRKLFHYPPFTHLIKIGFSGEDKEKTFAAIKEARSFLIQKLPSSFEFLPVAPAGHAKIQNRYRFQFLIKTKKILAASSTLLLLQTKFKSKEFQLSIDIDPSSTFF